MIYGNVCDTQLPSEAYDMVMTWSVFEHLPDPEYALKNLQDALRPGGVLFISIHLFTSINGSHDIRAFTGFEDELPLWGHLRPAVKDQIVPSAYLNEWRLGKWRELFGRLAPGHVEKLEVYDFAKKYEPRLSLALEEELKDFSREELFTVDIKYVWRKPSA
jgi:SAM-dependent methyltransferase